MPRLLCIFTLSLICIAAGCRTPMQRLDKQVGAMIEQRQTEAMGETTPHNLAPIETDPASRSMHDTTPATVNLAADQLDATVDTDPLKIALDGSNMPAVLDDPETATAMDLTAIMAHAIEHAPEYRNRKEDLYLSVLSLIAERHLWGPRFFDTISSTLSGTPESGDFDTANRLVNEFSITQRLPYGGEVAVTALVDYVNTLREASVGPRDEQSASVALSIDLPLLRGAGMVAREDRIQAERNVIYSVREFERFRREFLVEIANTYFDLIRRQRSLENQRFQVENLERLAQRFEALAQAGRQPPFEAEFAQQSVLFERNNLLNAEESYAAAVDSFKLRIGLPITQGLVIELEKVDVPTPKLDSARAVMVAWQNRLDLQTSRDRVDDARRTLAVAKNNMLPDLDLFGEVSARSDDSSERGSVDLQLDEGAYRVGARLDVPLDRTIERTRVRSAQIGLERQTRSYTLFRDQVSLQVRRSVRAIEQARITLELQQRNVELAERRTVGVQLRERQLGPRDVIEAQEDLLAAKDRRDAAMADLRRNVLQYLLDTGQMRVAANGGWQAPVNLRPETDSPASES